MAEGKILPYLDIPFQHASPRILRAMKRPASGADILERVQRWRDTCPELAIRSTFIVGFPGETEADFQALLEFLEEAQLDRVGCFAYSPVEGAAANALPGAVADEIKEERRARLMKAQARISAKRLARKVGKTIEVLVDAVESDVAIARSHADAPEIDGVVQIAPGGELKPGDLVKVRVTGSDEHDLAARPSARPKAAARKAVRA